MEANSRPDIVAATEQANIGISLVDADFRYTWVNQKYCDLLGYSSKDLVGHSPLEFTHPTTEQQVKFEAPLPPDMQNLLSCSA